MSLVVYSIAIAPVVVAAAVGRNNCGEEKSRFPFAMHVCYSLGL
jgi:ABC-type uncharacterized transport system permease subunit